MPPISISQTKLGIGGAEMIRQRGFQAGQPGGTERRNDGEPGNHDPCGNHDLAACLPILASHQSPADFSGGVSGFTGLDRVNAYPLQLENAA